MENVLRKLKISDFAVAERVKRAIVEIMESNLDALAGFANDLGRTSAITHTI